MRLRPLPTAILLMSLIASGCRKPQPEPIRYNLGELAPAPDWDRLHAFQRTISREDFVTLLDDVYGEAERKTWQSTISIRGNAAEITTSTADPSAPSFKLHFTEYASTSPPRTWRSAAELNFSPAPLSLPLHDLKIAIDPGHIGGEWAKMEERWYQVGEDTKPVMEGSMTLAVAKLLKPRLEALGATVTLVRDSEEPVTDKRPEDFLPEVIESLRAQGIDPENPPSPAFSPRRQAEKRFYRTAEIRARATKINTIIKPDIVLCLHFNADAWGAADEPLFSTNNHLHFLVNGCYSQGEFSLDDQRLDLLENLLQRNHSEETALSDTLAATFAAESGLPPFIYPGTNARAVGTTSYVSARNLLATRLYKCPTAFFEPYIMNNAEVFERIQHPDKDPKKSIFQEYADAVTEGLATYYRHHRTQ